MTLGQRFSAQRVPRGRRLALGPAASLVVLLGLAGVLPDALAGAQEKEVLSAQVRTALSAAIAGDRKPPEPKFASQAERIDWLDQMSQRLPRRHFPTFQERMDFLKTLRYEAQRAGLDPQLVLALVEAESGFRRYAVSYAGARGYSQVMPFWASQIGDGDPSVLFDMRSNLRFGCTILRYYLDREGGDLFLALGRYNGSRGRSEYPDLVLGGLKRKWTYTFVPAAAPVTPTTSVPTAPSPATGLPNAAGSPGAQAPATTSPSTTSRP